ncbi:MAG: MFS transporter [Caulobacteraceae bacterium]
MSAAAPPAPTPPPPAAPIPWLSLTAVLLGTFISTLNGRLSNFGLSDIRGALHAGFDEGAWITTAQTTAQMLIAPIAVWMGTAFGPRRVLFWSASAFAVISFIEPFSTDLQTLLVFQFAGGIASGFFIPLTLSFILKNIPPKYWAYGIAIYALNLELSLNISASVEGWYVEYTSWHWIFWQNVPLAAAMALCLHYGSARDAASPPSPRPDLYGFLAGGLGTGLIYAALDQGNRLDWLNSGLITGLLAAGGLLIAGFFIHEARTPNPGLNLKFLFAPPMPQILILIGFLRLTILATSYLVPQYLQTVRGFRALEVGQTLLLIAAPQLIVCPLAAALLRRNDSRLISGIGFVMVSVACFLVAYGLTPQWGSEEFLPSQLLQALGQSFALSGVLFFAVLHLRPQDALTFGAGVQIARLMGGEIGQSFVVTLTRIRTQTASNTIGLHVQSGDEQVLQRIHAYTGVAFHNGSDLFTAPLQGTALLATAVRRAASTQGVIDAFAVVGVLSIVALVAAATHKAAPRGPASHVSGGLSP